MTESDPYTKVLFRVPEDDGTENVETLWATRVGQEQYRLDNSPFYAYGVSWQDVVFAPADEDQGLPTFVRVVSKSGHRTIRVIFDPPAETGNASERLLQGLTSRGCTYEGANRSYMSIDIPPDVNLDVVRQYLVDNNATWEHADPTHDELFLGGTG